MSTELTDYKRMDDGELVSVRDWPVKRWKKLFAPTLCTQRGDRNMPGRIGQERMSPRLTYGRHFGPPLPDSRRAAVLVLICRIDDDWQIPFTVRPAHLRAHAGQVSLPGGAIEPSESSDDAALREFQEELGCETSSFEIIGRLTSIFVYNSNFYVTPWIGITDAPIQFQPNEDEVADWFALPLRDLQSALPIAEKLIQRGSLQFSAPAFEYDSHQIWGATSMILSELCHALAPPH